MLELTGFGVDHHQAFRLRLAGGVRGDGDARQGGGEDEDTDTSDKGLLRTLRPRSIGAKPAEREPRQPPG